MKSKVEQRMRDDPMLGIGLAFALLSLPQALASLFGWSAALEGELGGWVLTALLVAGACVLASDRRRRRDAEVERRRHCDVVLARARAARRGEGAGA